jgi:uncharacterized membrane protein YqhA
MKRIVEKTRYLALIAAVSSLLASVAAFLAGAIKTGIVIIRLFQGARHGQAGAIELVALMDAYLIATALLIFGLGMYELFVQDIELPASLTIKNLHDLKAKLGSVIVLVMAVTFLERLVEGSPSLGTLYLGLAVAAVSAALIAFAQFGGKD